MHQKFSKFSISWFQHFGHQSFLQGHRHDHENVKSMVMGMIKPSQSTQSNSLQGIYNISKKKLWMEFIMDFIKIKTSTSWIIDFLWKPDMYKVPNQGSFLDFCNILRKSIATVFLLYFDAKHSDTLWGSSHVWCYLFLGGCGQKWAWSFRSWNSEICLISREWIDKMSWFFLHVDTNLGKPMLI